MKACLFLVLIATACFSCINNEEKSVSIKPRIIVTSDGEIDDECSMVRFLLYANEWDIEGIITSSLTVSLAWTQVGR